MTSQRNKNWIFIRGLIREQLHWDGFVDQFSQALNVDIKCVDLPGAGIYYQEDSPNSITKIVDHIEKHFGPVDGKPNIMAHSMGCVVALEWIRRHPTSFSGAIFTNTSVGGICPMFERIRLSALPVFAKIAIAHQSDEVRESAKFNLICADETKRNHSVDLWIKIQKLHPVSLKTSWSQIRAAKAYRVQKKPPIPLLLLTSLGDRLVNPSCTERISKAWEAPIATHLWGGHDLFHDDPDWIISQTKSWLAKQHQQ